jgi:hypothetical protein
MNFKRLKKVGLSRKRPQYRSSYPQREINNNNSDNNNNSNNNHNHNLIRVWGGFVSLP